MAARPRGADTALGRRPRATRWPTLLPAALGLPPSPRPRLRGTERGPSTRHCCRPRLRRSGAGDPAAQQVPPAPRPSEAGKRARRGLCARARAGGGTPPSGRGAAGSSASCTWWRGQRRPGAGLRLRGGWGDTEAATTRALHPAEHTAAWRASKRRRNSGRRTEGRDGEASGEREVEARSGREKVAAAEAGKGGRPPGRRSRSRVSARGRGCSPWSVRAPPRAAASAPRLLPAAPLGPLRRRAARASPWAPRRSRAAGPPVRRRAPSEARDQAAEPPELAAGAGRPPRALGRRDSPPGAHPPPLPPLRPGPRAGGCPPPRAPRRPPAGAGRKVAPKSWYLR